MVLKNHRSSLLRLALAATLALAMGGCGITYIAQATNGQLAVMRAREPIDKVLARPETSDSLREQLLRAKRIRDFASLELALPDNASFRSYADIHRPYVVWNVVATPELSVEPRQWCFPVAGCVAYRGYFKEQDARDFAARLQGEGDDVTVGGVPAYSTLGRSADPVLSTVAGYGELDLAALIFHELAHQVVYLPGNSGFNEAYATAVEEAGVARYAAAHDKVAALTLWQQRRRQRVTINRQFNETRGALSRLFADPGAEADKRAGKATLLAKLSAEVRAQEQRTGRPSGYGAWIDAGLNNAHLALVATYYEQLPQFEALLQETCGGYMACFHVQAAGLAAKQDAQKKKGPGG